MADNGKLYSGFDKDFPLKMAKLCKYADVILPNISEAAFMTGMPYPGENASNECIKDLLLSLAKLGSKKIVITGVESADHKFGFMGYDSETKEFFEYYTPKVQMKSHGTGDVFASTFTGALMNDYNIQDSLKIAADFTKACINNTYNDPEAVNYAVNFESEIPYLLKLIRKV